MQHCFCPGLLQLHVAIEWGKKHNVSTVLTFRTMLQPNFGKYIPAIAKERNIEVHTGSVITERKFANKSTHQITT